LVTAQLFGEKLRRARERRNLSLQRIAADTKIGRRLLADIEIGDCSRWPGGIYARAYMRTYGRAIGMDPEELVADFCEIFPQFARPEPVEPAPDGVTASMARSASARRGWFAQLRDLFHRADGRFDLFFGIERSK
jgi:cytoskeletal protein RodZ